MKKLFVFVLALALFIPAMASAQIKWNGQIDVLGYSLDDAGFANSGTSNTYSRFILGANFGLAENIEGNASIMYFTTWGDNYLAGQQIDNSSDTGILSSVRLIEANVVFKNLFDNDKISVKIGKQFYDGGTLFYVGPRDLICTYLFSAMTSNPYPYYLTEDGMEGVVVTYNNNDNLKLDLGYSKLTNENTPLGDKTNVSFINAKYKVNDALKIDGYLYDSETTNTGYKRFEYLGIKPALTIGSLSASLELTQVFGDDDGSMFSTSHTADGYFAKIDASYDIEALKLRGMYLMTGSQFYAPYTQNIYIGYYYTSSLRGMFSGDFFGQMFSIDALNFGADYTLNKFKFMMDYFRIGDRDDANKMYEIDLGVQYNYTENVAFKGGIGYLGNEANGALHESVYLLGVTYKFGSK